MKKFLVSLCAVAISTSSFSTIISCTYNNNTKEVIKKETTLFSEISAEALKSAILFDQNFQNDSNSSINVDFSTSYYSSKTVKNIFPNLVTDNANVSALQDSQVSELYKMMFGRNQGGSTGFDYNFKESLKSKSLTTTGVREGTKLSELAKYTNKEIPNEAYQIVEKAPNTALPSTIGAITGGLNVILGNDFNPETAGLMNGVLSSSLVGDLLAPILKDEDKQVMISSISSYIDLHTNAITTALESLTQEKIQTDKMTFDVLNDGINDLFTALTFFYLPIWS